MALFDIGWRGFINIFKRFATQYDIQYINFFNNYITMNNQKVRLQKAILNFYFNFPSFRPIWLYNQRFDIFSEAVFGIKTFKYALIKKKELLKDLLKEELSKDPKFYVEDVEDSINKITIFPNYLKPKSVELFFEYIDKRIIIDDIYKFLEIDEKKFKEDLKDQIREKFENISSSRLPNKQGMLKAVISVNPVDIFMASTGKNWTSCISMESDYEAAYWSGIPGAMIDKNRAIVYITNGEKDRYKEIVIDKMMARSWLLLVRFDRKKTGVFVHRSYPIEIDFKKIIEKHFEKIGVEIFAIGKDGLPEDMKGRYYFEALYHKLNFNFLYKQKGNYNNINLKDLQKLCMIYLDHTKVSFAKKNKTKYFPTGYLKHKVSIGGEVSRYRLFNNDKKQCKEYNINTLVNDTPGFYFCNRLSQLISTNDEIGNHHYLHSHDTEDEEYYDDEDEEYYDDEDGNLW